MNIQIDQKVFKSILKRTISYNEIGSCSYNISNSNSDKDLLLIYVPSKLELYSNFVSHHQYQYKLDNVDYIFTSLPNFINNILSGDSTINFEYLTQLKESDRLYFLKEIINDIPKHKLIKSYLGIANRDFRQINKGKFSLYKQNKKLIHLHRTKIFIDRFLKDDYNVDLSEFKHLYKSYLNIDLKKERFDIANSIYSELKLIRSQINDLNLNLYCSKDTMKYIDENILNIYSKYLEEFDNIEYYQNVSELNYKYKHKTIEYD